jgi:hypothetical protein
MQPILCRCGISRSLLCAVTGRAPGAEQVDKYLLTLRHAASEMVNHTQGVAIFEGRLLSCLGRLLPVLALVVLYYCGFAI